MRETYEKLDIDTLTFENEDIITNSLCPEDTSCPQEGERIKCPDYF